MRVFRPRWNQTPIKGHLFMPGDIIEYANGERHEIKDNGEWRRVKAPTGHDRRIKKEKGK